MTKLQSIIDIFDTTWGKTILADITNEPMLHVGDIIDTPAGVFKIKGINMPTKPTENLLVGIIVE